MQPSIKNNPDWAPTLAYELHGNCYLNVTWRCTLRCDFCPKFNGTWEVQGYDLRLLQEPTVDQVMAAIGDPKPYKEMVFCGLGEPTLAIDTLLAVARRLKAEGKRIRINTDGLGNLVHGRDITREMKGLVDSLSVSLNAQNSEVYDRHCRPKHRGSFPAVLGFIRAAKENIPEVVATAIDGLEGVDIEACRRIAEEELGVQFRRRVLDNVG